LRQIDTAAIDSRYCRARLWVYFFSHPAEHERTVARAQELRTAYVLCEESRGKLTLCALEAWKLLATMLFGPRTGYCQ